MNRSSNFLYNNARNISFFDYSFGKRGLSYKPPRTKCIGTATKPSPWGPPGPTRRFFPYPRRKRRSNIDYYAVQYLKIHVVINSAKCLSATKMKQKKQKMKQNATEQ